MKHIVIGTSGHIDHGKTALVKALTGFDMDTLEEEKRRGITINNGYTYFSLSDGRRAGIIDVPGHEKFIKNMVAGVTSIDLVLFVIAADDGIMPQTIEHFNILNTLNVKNGVVVLTKIDLVDDEWLEFIKDEVKNFVKGSFLENAPIVPVSSKTLKGIDTLKKTIEECVNNTEEKDKEALFRMPIDRVFTVKGFGSVVTGSILEGRAKVGDDIELYPGNKVGRIRGIQVHGEDRNVAEAGERCAINLSGVDKDFLERGLIIGEVSKESSTYIIDCKITIPKYCEKVIKNRDRIRVHHGTREVIGRIIILEKDELKGGDCEYCQIRLEKEICCKDKDRIVLRTYSPMITLGGGVILNSLAEKAKREDLNYIKDLKARESDSLEDKIELAISKEEGLKTLKDLLKEFKEDEEEIKDSLNKLIDNKKIIALNEGVIHNKVFTKKAEELNKTLENYHKEEPLKVGMKKEECKSKLFSKKLKKETFDEFINLMLEKDLIDSNENYVFKKGFEPKLSKREEQIKEIIINTYLENGFTTPKFKDVIKDDKEKAIYNKIFKYLKDRGDLVYINENIVFHKEYVQKGKDLVKEYLSKKGVATIGEIKDSLNIQRKYLVPFLEYLDKEKVTKRVDEGRVLF
ncbi:selenocysteine-specific translation elongation factor [Eubacterium multiforme]|uniref:Selenocysteine-specific elongation factor n=1 Tax=Eubacterium multiforme TaxID=83339 RepID=A0ABT9UWN1_9FIRM|nr:selenocysteine-specific translation elongation factor [Eubacterium multiforme]MDQ0150718.1 selenocysteine-specific elongation factor [Eubacterium multiforme]